MNILWCGGEDIDFPNGGASSFAIDTNGGRFRSGYARYGIYSNQSGIYPRSNPFPGGAVTSCWLTFRIAYGAAGGYVPCIGLVNSATVRSGLWIETTNNVAQPGLWKFTDSGATLLASASIAPMTNYTLLRFDIQVNYGTSATVNVFINGQLALTYTGDVTVAGVSNLDSVAIYGYGTYAAPMSEIIVADSDTRGLQGLLTMALTGAGTTDGWTGTYSNINGNGYSDANPVYTNAATLNEQFNVTDLPSGSFTIVGCKISARTAKSADSTPSKIALGYNSGGSVAVGTSQSPGLAYGTLEQYDQTNPVTGNPFLQSEVNALQVNAQSVA